MASRITEYFCRYLAAAPFTVNVQNKQGASAERKKNEENGPMGCLERPETHTEQTQQLFSP